MCLTILWDWRVKPGNNQTSQTSQIFPVKPHSDYSLHKTFLQLIWPNIRIFLRICSHLLTFSMKSFMENFISCAVTGKSNLKNISNRSIRALFNLALPYNSKLLLVCKKLLVEIAGIQYQFVWAKNLSLDIMITKNVLCKQGKKT